MRLRIFVLMVLLVPFVLVAQTGRGSLAQETNEGQPPREVPAAAQRPKPDLSDLERLRFVTDSDYPPFNYLDENGTLTGFNVDLAAAICDELEVECLIRPLPWDELLSALAENRADAAIASIKINEETLTKADFTDSYYHTPARFVARKDSTIESVTPETAAGHKIAVVRGTAHEAFLRDFFDQAQIVPFDNAGQAETALRSGAVDLLFGDGITLMFWLNGTASSGCCEFRSGPYTESRYFGEGIGIAVKLGNRKMREILDYGLEQVRASGRFEELLLRYFPMSIL